MMRTFLITLITVATGIAPLCIHAIIMTRLEARQYFWEREQHRWQARWREREHPESGR